MFCLCKRPLKSICSRKSCKQYRAFCDSPQCSLFTAHKSHPKYDLNDWLADQETINKQREQEEEQKHTNILLNELKKQLRWIKSHQFRLNPCAKFLTLMKKLRRDGPNTKIPYELLQDIDQLLQTRRQKPVSNSRQSLNQVLVEMRDKMKKCMQIMYSATESQELIMGDIEVASDQNDIIILEEPSKMQQENIHKSQEQHLSVQKNINQRQKSYIKYIPEYNQKQILTIEDRQFIIDSFDKSKVKSITKIYTGGALQHQFKQSVFRQKCGNLKNTLIVAQYAKQNTKTPNKSYFAGFTPIEIWNNKYREKQMQSDPSRLSRIFWFRSDREEKRVFNLNTPAGENALQVDERYGIMFGSDLIINLRGGQKSKAINLGKYYESTPPLTQEEQKDIDFINDSVRGRTLEYQLYQIQFEQVKLEQRS